MLLVLQAKQVVNERTLANVWNNAPETENPLKWGVVANRRSSIAGKALRGYAVVSAACAMVQETT